MFINMLLIIGFVGWWKNIVDKSKFDIKFIIYYLYKCKKKNNSFSFRIKRKVINFLILSSLWFFELNFKIICSKNE